MTFSRQHSNGSLRWSVTIDGETVTVERACVNFFEAEYGQRAHDEVHAEVTRAEFPARDDLREVVEQGLGTAGLDAVLAHLGAPPSGRTPARAPAPQVGAVASTPPPPAEPSPRSGLRATLGAVAVVLLLWSVLGVPGFSLMRDAWSGLWASEVPVEGVVVSTRSRGLVTHAVGGKGRSAPLRRYEGDVVLRVEGGRLATLTVTAPDIVRGEATLLERLSSYGEGARVALWCQQDTPAACRFESESNVGTRLSQVAQFLFGVFLFSLVPGLLAMGLWLGRRG